MDTVFLEAIEFYAYHGASDAEQQVGHRYRVDLRARLDVSKAGHSDVLLDTVDYGALAALVVREGRASQHRLVETLAERIAEAVFATFPVERVWLRVAKIAPPMDAICGAAGVEIERERAREPQVR